MSKSQACDENELFEAEEDHAIEKPGTGSKRFQ